MGLTTKVMALTAKVMALTTKVMGLITKVIALTVKVMGLTAHKDRLWRLTIGGKRKRREAALKNGKGPVMNGRVKYSRFFF